MNYYTTKVLQSNDFDGVIEKVTDALKKEQFGILTDIDISATLKKKLDVDFKKYRILGACNPPFAHKALQAEDKIGVMLPCNVIVQQINNNEIEVSAMDPLEVMKAIGNPNLNEMAEKVSQIMKKVIESL